MENLKDKILGCMVGGAVGDALGYPVEFMTYNQIIADYGPKGIARYKLGHNGMAEISDDTQMSLYTAVGLLIDDIQGAYIEWFKTQQIGASPQAESKCWISHKPELYSRRAPGLTCISALGAIEKGMEAKNDSKGCGGIMRVAPIALWGAANNIDVKDSVKRGFEAAAITHKHTLGWFSAGMLVYVIQRILQEGVSDKDSLIGVLNDSREIYEDVFKLETAESLNQFYLGTKRAIELANSDVEDVKAIKELGEGWTGEEAWYISLFCTLRHFDSFEDAVVASVNHSGDSDSTGAITGNIMGAIHGYSSIPEYFKTNLELRDTIEKVANDLAI